MCFFLFGCSPGGTEATETLHAWARLNDQDRVLELASGLGRGGMSLASKYGCHVLLTDTDQGRLDEAAAVAKTSGLSDLVSTGYLDMNHMDDELSDDDHFAAAIVEASLTHQRDKSKAKILQDLSVHAEQILVHEVCFKGDASDEELCSIKLDMSKHLSARFEPLTEQGWKDLLENNNYRVTNFRVGPMSLLHPTSMLVDEGPLGVAKIAWNLVIHADLRHRVVETRAAMMKYSDVLGYIIIRAVRKDDW